MLKLILTMPPSANDRLTIARNGKRLIKREKYRAWQDSTAWAIKSQLGALEQPAPLNCPLLSVIHIIARDKRRRDYDNVAKCVNDALQIGGAITDDSLIKCAFSYSTLDRDNGGIVEVFLGHFEETDCAEATALINKALDAQRNAK